MEWLKARAKEYHGYTVVGCTWWTYNFNDKCWHGSK